MAKRKSKRRSSQPRRPVTRAPKAAMVKELNLAEEYHIRVIPAAIIIYNGTSYIEGVTLSVSEAYQLIRKDPDRFTTSALTPAQFLEEYRELSKETQDIFHIALSSALSANYKTAGLASEMLLKESPQTNLKIFDCKP